MVDTARVAQATVLGRDYADGEIIHKHSHAEAQLLYGLTGLAMVETDAGAWLMPPDYGLWIPPRTPHTVRMLGGVAMRSLYLMLSGTEDFPQRCEVLAVTRLVRELLSESAAIPSDSPLRDDALLRLLLIEIPRLQPVALFVPMPTTPALRQRCQQFLLAPTSRETTDQWCQALNMSRRTFIRHFRQQTGLSFVDWRQRACMTAAIPRLLSGISVTRIATELDYDNPAAFSSMFKKLSGVSPRHYRTRQ